MKLHIMNHFPLISIVFSSNIILLTLFSNRTIL